MNTIKGNKLIAAFRGYDGLNCEVCKYNYDCNHLQCGLTKNEQLELVSYDSSWDWLMPVVEHVESLGYEVSILDDECEISNIGYRVATHVAIKADTKIEAVWLAMIEFIINYDKISNYEYI